jgi:hypothetical protein
MSCLGKNYRPIPPRVWSRVENVCVYNTQNSVTTATTGTLTEEDQFKPVYFAPLKRYIPPEDVGEAYQMIRKGNILQYKKNSSNLTQKEKYSKIARAQWTNRTTTWATQGQAYSQPNTNQRKRIGAINIDLNTGLPTYEPITCRQPISPSYYNALPARNLVPLANEPTVPNLNTTGSINPFPPIMAVDQPAPIVIQDGGNLIYNIQENPCTGETVVYPPPSKCYPTSASDVPGPEMLICYNDNLPTYYPKNRLTMNNSTDKWPVNAKLIRSMTDVPSQNVNTNFAPFREVIMFEDLLAFDPTLKQTGSATSSLKLMNTNTNTNTSTNINTNTSTDSATLFKASLSKIFKHMDALELRINDKLYQSTGNIIDTLSRKMESVQKAIIDLITSTNV